MANFGEILNNIAIGAGQSVRRNVGDTDFEAFTPTSGSGGFTVTLSGEVTGNGTESGGSVTINTTLAADSVGIAALSATGTPSSSTFLRGDNTWSTPSGGGLEQYQVRRMTRR